MALLQTIAINGIIYFPQRLRWGNNEPHVDGTLKRSLNVLHTVHSSEKLYFSCGNALQARNITFFKVIFGK